MIKLVHNEMIKYFYRFGTIVMSAIILGLILLNLFLTNSFGYSDDLLEHSYDAKTWKTEVKKDITDIQKKLADIQGKHKGKVDDVKKFQKQQAYQNRLDMLNQYLKKDIQPPSNKHFFGAMSEVGGFIGLSLIMVVVITSAMMSREFQQGTIKLLLIRPKSRTAIFISKWIAAVCIAFLFTLITYVLKATVALFTTKMDPTNQFVFQMMGEHKVKAVSFWPFLGQLFINDFILMAIFATIAFVLSVILRNTALSLGITLGLQFFSQLIVSFISAKTNLVKYIWPANWNLNQYVELASVKPDDDMTLMYSSIYNVIAIIIIIVIGLVVFNKRDVAN